MKGGIFKMDKTIAAISTAQGAGGIGVIRISGERAVEISDDIFRAKSNKKISDLKGYTAAFGDVYYDNEKIDEAVALVFRAPHSYTGEDVVEISCHGGIYVTKQVLRAVLNSGASAAGPGEFTKRAFLNGKIDLTEAEAVMDIIGAKGKSAARAAIACKEGSISKKTEQVCNNLIDIAAHLSAWADYPEEDIPQVTAKNLRENIKNSLFEIDSLLKNYDAGKAVKEGIDTIIVGKPNVGKSTLMNLLSGCEKSIVTDIPGTTRDIIEETVILGDIILLLSDTAGLRETENPVEKIGVDRAKEKIKSCGLVLAVFDGSQELSDEDKKLIDDISDVPSIAIINKTDKEIKIDADYITKSVSHVVFISAVENKGIDELEKAVAEITGTADFDPSAATFSTERQYDCGKRARQAVIEALDALNMGMTLDAVTVSLEDAISCLLEITGKRASEAVVENVFSKFCVGK